MNNNNLDKNTINNIKNMVDNGDISGAISQISPEMINNFSKLLSNSQKGDTNNGNNSNSSSNAKNSNNYSNSNNLGFDLGNIDMNTILKMKSAMEKMNTSNDPRANLLSSLKPYLRDSKKEKLDQYATLLKMANVAELMRNENKGNDN